MDSSGQSPAPVKKRKKRKPKQGSAAKHEAHDSESTQEQSDKQEVALRFAEALKHLQQNSVDSTWTKLDSCNIFDGKTKKIAKAMLHNKELLSLDLSNNHIGPAGLEALAESLLQGAAPELIMLNLQGNNLTVESQPIFDKLSSLRKQLKIQLVEDDPWDSAQLESAKRKTLWSKDSPEKDTPEKVADKPIQTPPNSFWQRFFQMGGGARIFGSQESQSSEPAEPAENAEVVWAQVNEELGKEDVQISELSKHLHALAVGVKIEMDTCAVPFLSNTKLEELRPYTKQAVQGLERLQAVLEISGTPVLTTFSKSTPMGGVGSHVLMVAQIVERLSYARTGVINIHIVKASLVPQLMALSFKFPTCSPLQSTCCQIMRWMIASQLRLLWEPLLRPSMGTQAGSGIAEHSNLISLIIEILETASSVETVAKRPCETGFALHIACQLYYESSKVDTLKTTLLACPEWHALVADGSTFHRLRMEQEGELCGPKPSKDQLPSRQLPAADEVEREAVESSLSKESHPKELRPLVSPIYKNVHLTNIQS